MKLKKQLIIMLCIIAVLGIIIVLGLNVGYNSKQNKAISKPILDTINMNEVAKIEIKDNVEFVKEGKNWLYVEKNDQTKEHIPKPTRQDHISDMLEAMANFSRGRLIDVSPKDLSKYKLDADSSVQKLVLKDKDDNELLRLKIGVVVGAFPANYAQINENSEVYQIDNTLVHFLNQEERYWLDLRIFPNSFNINRVEHLKITRDDKKDISFKKNRKEWIDEDDDSSTISEDAIITYLENLNTIRAHSFESPILKDGMLRGKIEITLANDNVLEVFLYFFANKYFVTTKGGQENETLTFQENRIEELFPEYKTFVPVESKEVDTESVDVLGGAPNETPNVETPDDSINGVDNEKP